MIHMHSFICYYSIVIITLAAKRRCKGTVYHHIVCVCVYVCSQKIGKTTTVSSSNELLADFQLHKEQK